MSFIEGLAEREKKFKDEQVIEQHNVNMYIGAFSAILTVGLALCFVVFGLWVPSLVCIIPFVCFVTVAYHSWKWLKNGEGNGTSR